MNAKSMNLQTLIGKQEKEFNRLLDTSYTDGGFKDAPEDYDFENIKSFLRKSMEMAYESGYAEAVSFYAPKAENLKEWESK